MKDYIVVKKRIYYDSVKLMLVTGGIKAMDGIVEVAVVMGTPLNKETLQRTSFKSDEIDQTTPSDLIIAIRANQQEHLDNALSKLDELLNSTNSSSNSSTYKPKSIEAGQKQNDSNICIISVPGKYATDLSMDALKNKMNVLLFSDNVSIEDELKLKEYSTSKNLLLMGPDCGTAMINGTPLGFANKVKSGKIGIIAASGTGLQEVMVLLHQNSIGIKQAIGTGGRDLSEKIGALTMLQALKALNEDDDIDILLIISKPPAQKVADKILNYVNNHIKKPIVINFLGDYTAGEHADNVYFEKYLEDAALEVVRICNQDAKKQDMIKDSLINEYATNATKNLSIGRKYIKGLYSGGTLNYESYFFMKDNLDLYSNSSKDPNKQITNIYNQKKHSMIDLGDDKFTVGRAHPMIDPTLRAELFEMELKDKENAVIILDIVLGYGANREPEKAFIEILEKNSHIKNDRPVIIAYVLGTNEDPQPMEEIIEKLKAQGVIVMPSNKSAAKLGLEIIKKLA